MLRDLQPDSSDAQAKLMRFPSAIHHTYASARSTEQNPITIEETSKIDHTGLHSNRTRGNSSTESPLGSESTLFSFGRMDSLPASDLVYAWALLPPVSFKPLGRNKTFKGKRLGQCKWQARGFRADVIYSSHLVRQGLLIIIAKMDTYADVMAFWLVGLIEKKYSRRHSDDGTGQSCGILPLEMSQQPTILCSCKPNTSKA